MLVTHQDPRPAIGPQAAAPQGGLGNWLRVSNRCAACLTTRRAHRLTAGRSAPSTVTQIGVGVERKPRQEETARLLRGTGSPNPEMGSDDKGRPHPTQSAEPLLNDALAHHPRVKISPRGLGRAIIQTVKGWCPPSGIARTKHTGNLGSHIQSFLSCGSLFGGELRLFA